MRDLLTNKLLFSSDDHRYAKPKYNIKCFHLFVIAVHNRSKIETKVPGILFDLKTIHFHSNTILFVLRFW